jgi:negative regulator of flagellin synthesis FlgM
MRITNGAAVAAMTEATQPITVGKTAGAARATRPATETGPTGAVQAIKAAHAAFSQAPEIDAARVAEIKAALAAGELPFDAGKLARLVIRHHGGSD